MSMSQWLQVRGRPLFANAEIPGDLRNPELFRLSGIAEQVMGVLVNIDVDDLSKAVTSYQRAAGLRIAGGVGSARSFAPHHLPAHDPPASRPSTRTDALRRNERHGRQYISISSSRILNPPRRQTIEPGATVEGRLRHVRRGRIAYLAAPFGHGICLIEFQGRGYDEIVDELRRPPSPCRS
jgi:hypothetical protein